MSRSPAPSSAACCSPPSPPCSSCRRCTGCCVASGRYGRALRSRGTRLRPLDHASVERRGEGTRGPGSPMNVTPGAGRRMQILAGGVAILLLVGFFLVHHFRSRDESLLAQTTAEQSGAPLPVDVVTARPSPTTQTLMLPGETAAWY